MSDKRFYQEYETEDWRRLLMPVCPGKIFKPKKGKGAYKRYQSKPVTKVIQEFELGKI